jgi:hypothetical protein
MVRRELVAGADGTITFTPPPKRPSRKSAKPTPSSLPLFSRHPSEQAIARIRKDFAGWDVYALKAEFDAWIDESPDRSPKDYDAALYGFVKRHAARNQG